MRNAYYLPVTGQLKEPFFSSEINIFFICPGCQAAVTIIVLPLEVKYTSMGKLVNKTRLY